VPIRKERQSTGFIDSPVTVNVRRDTIVPQSDLRPDRRRVLHVGRGNLSAIDRNDAHGDRMPVGRSEHVLETTLPMKVDPS
jgi:hypothetical protein